MTVHSFHVGDQVTFVRDGSIYDHKSGTVQRIDHGEVHPVVVKFQHGDIHKFSSQVLDPRWKQANINDFVEIIESSATGTIRSIHADGQRFGVFLGIQRSINFFNHEEVRFLDAIPEDDQPTTVFKPGDIVVINHEISPFHGHTAMVAVIDEDRDIVTVQVSGGKLLNYSAKQLKLAEDKKTTGDTTIGRRVSVHDRHHPLYGHMGTVVGLAPNGTGNLIVDFDSGTKGLLISPSQCKSKPEPEPDAEKTALELWPSTIEALIRYWQIADAALDAMVYGPFIVPKGMTKESYIAMRAHNFSRCLMQSKMRIQRGVQSIAESVGYPLSESKTVWLMNPGGTISRVFPWDIPFDLDKLDADLSVIYDYEGKQIGKIQHAVITTEPVTVQIIGVADLE